jgi:hypothetical protein
MNPTDFMPATAVCAQVDRRPKMIDGTRLPVASTIHVRLHAVAANADLPTLGSSNWTTKSVKSAPPPRGVLR